MYISELSVKLLVHRSTVRNIKCMTIYHIDHLAVLEIIKYQRRQSKLFVPLDFSTVYVLNIDSLLHLILEQLSEWLWV